VNQWSLRALVATLALCAVCGAAPGAFAQIAKPRPGQPLVLPAPAPSVVVDGCKTLEPSDATTKLTLPQTMFEDFHDFDPAHTRWSLAYYRPNDPVAAHTHDMTDEQQIFVDPSYAGSADHALGLNPFELVDGKLNIVARRLPDDLRSVLYNRVYSSGLLHSREFFSQLYGYFEASIQIPAGQALWPAFWLIPTHTPTPPELDILESLGHKPHEVYSTLHFNYRDPKNGHIECRHNIPDATKRSVVYGALWTPDMVVYYIDRVPVRVVRAHPTMRKPMHLILNLAVGGNWPGKVSDATPPEARMIVDWVAGYSVKETPPGAR
jgi:beta-glucanase (GH16 family)